MTTQGEHERNLVLLPRQLALSCGRVSERTLLVEINHLSKVLWCLIPAHFGRNFTSLPPYRAVSLSCCRMVTEPFGWQIGVKELGFRGRTLGHWGGELVDGIHSWSLTFLPLKSYLSNRKSSSNHRFFRGYAGCIPSLDFLLDLFLLG